MLVPENRVSHAFSLRVYVPGEGDPRPNPGPRNWYTPAGEAARSGSANRDGNGQFLAEYLQGTDQHGEEVPGGIVCRGFVVRQDTELADYTTTNGLWAEEQAGTGANRPLRLVQYDTTELLEFRAEGPNFPADSCFVVSVRLWDTPPDLADPLARLEVGDAWGVEIRKDRGAALVEKQGLGWYPVMDLGDPTPAAQNDADEFLIFWRVHRGMIWVSWDGRQWQVYRAAAPLSVPAGVAFSGKGGMQAWGLWQYRYYAAQFDSTTRSTFGDYSAATPSIGGRYYVPSGATLAFSDLSTAGAARWRATLTPVAVSAGLPWAVYYSPEVYAVRFRYAGGATTPTGAYTTPFDGRIVDSLLTKEQDPSQARLELTISKDPDTPLLWAPGRNAKASLWLGTVDCEGDLVWEPTAYFMGYIEPISAGLEEFRRPEIRLSMINLAEVFRRDKRWSELDRVPLGGQTVNMALDDILASEGYDSSYRSWHAAGDAYVLPLGSPENPCEFPPEGEAKWVTMERIASYAGLELSVSDNGIITSQAINYVSGTAHAVRGVNADDARRIITGGKLEYDSAANRTCVLVSVELEDGSRAMVMARNGAAEDNPASAMFSGSGRALEVESLGSGDLDLAIRRAEALGAALFPLQFSTELRTLLNIDVQRRHRLQVFGLESVGIADTDRFVVLTAAHYVHKLVSKSHSTFGGLRL
jgi:hypothetical protein